MKWNECAASWFLRKNVQTDVSFWGQYQVPPVEIRTQHRRFRDDITGVSGKQIDFNNKDSHPYNLIRKPFLSKTLYVGVLIIDQVIRNSTSKFWRVNGYHLLVLSFLRECFEADRHQCSAVYVSDESKDKIIFDMHPSASFPFTITRH